MVLRWLSSAVTLVSRPDRTEALLDRHDRLEHYREQLTKHYADAVALAAANPTASQETMAGLEADLNQAFEMMDTITEAARTLIRLRDQGEKSDLVVAKPPSSPAVEGRLPELGLPTFDGTMGSWVAFISLFDSLVHERADLSSTQKQAYLLSTLIGEPCGIISHLPLSEDNYEIARELLTSRYQNLRSLVDAHIEGILALPNLASGANIRTLLLNPLLVATNSLARLGQPADAWPYLLVYIVLKKLPQDLRNRFEEKHGGDDVTHLPPFTALIEFLGERCRRSEHAQSGRNLTEPKPSVPTRKPETAKRQPLRLVAAVTDTRCGFCKESTHSTASCASLLKRPVSARREIALNRRWCFNCLERHLQRDCPQSRPCRHCQGKHHPVLCANRNGSGYGRGREDEISSQRGSPTPRQPSARGPSPRYASRPTAPTGGGVRSPARNEGGGAPQRDFVLVDRDQPRSARPVLSPHREFELPLLEQPRLWNRPPRFTREEEVPSSQLAGCQRFSRAQWNDARYPTRDYQAPNQEFHDQ